LSATASAYSVVTRIPSVILVAQAGRSLAWPSTDTTQMRQFPAIGSLGYQHNVGISRPASRAALRIVEPSGGLTVRPLMVAEGIGWKLASGLRGGKRRCPLSGVRCSWGVCPIR